MPGKKNRKPKTGDDLSPEVKASLKMAASNEQISLRLAASQEQVGELVAENLKQKKELVPKAEMMDKVLRIRDRISAVLAEEQATPDAFFMALALMVTPMFGNLFMIHGSQAARRHLAAQEADKAGKEASGEETKVGTETEPNSMRVLVGGEGQDEEE